MIASHNNDKLAQYDRPTQLQNPEVDRTPPQLN